ncbi:hypothetical protein GLOIN_2v1845816 [Rhizophagus irregularis DAOM 181602=DAOM 197198]|uniref:Uncharacterized protein n=1 Tax=Rhizophagus irregularis (strain DAOM 181602 / DAOM 197198 / MUCL 43194) TaxID=747089 RepID=A0A2P4PDW6_RHIID|nr:hypothetical protein GLOIN_2v1845816 [Rhizophagus irregularis DAOM 181602=DAOM 197198]POG63575.1 hypothetical protein GLOIN_2v1845816 [Rhizophagus irregularis DAOM 181602=DAOM 197198]|eukprot:XP_025170441.1 hypothetical protein GLOIN_2v1845816 [Rhizophagus irregularis DAOM 181602=DAOM 197198]
METISGSINRSFCFYTIITTLYLHYLIKKKFFEKTCENKNFIAFSNKGEVFSYISQTSCRNSSCGLLVPPKAVLAGFLGFSEQFLWTSWTTSWLSGEDFS